MPTSLDPKSVLIVEDNWRLAGEWREMLEAAGLRVVLENDPELAIATLRQERFDVVIADLMLRNRSGQISREGSLMLLASIGLNAYLAPKVLAVSGCEETTQLYQSYGILQPASTLLKPVDPAELRRCVFELIQQRDGEMEASHMARSNQRWAVQRFKFATDHFQDAIY